MNELEIAATESAEDRANCQGVLHRRAIGAGPIPENVGFKVEGNPLQKSMQISLFYCPSLIGACFLIVCLSLKTVGKLW